MKTSETLSILFASLLFVGSATAPIAQTSAQDHDAHHPAESQAAPVAPTGEAPPPAGMQGGMPGMGMMTPEMMQMMQRMMGQGGMAGMMRGMQGQRMPEGGMGPGMTGQMPMMGGMMMCPMMTAVMGQQPGVTGTGMMASMAGGVRQGPDAMGLGVVIPSRSVTIDDVREHFDRLLQAQGNPRVKLGEIKDADKNSIGAEILTADGSLVDRFRINRRSGAIQRAQ